MKKNLKNAIALCVLWPAAMVAGLLLGLGGRIESTFARIAEWFDEWINERGES